MREFSIHYEDDERWEELYEFVMDHPDQFDPRIAKDAESRRRASVARRLWVHTPDIPESRPTEAT